MIWCPFPDEETAENIAAKLVEERLVACANILGSIKSVFLWEGKVQKSAECGVLFKTGTGNLANAVARLEQLHPYETPAIMGWDCSGASAGTASWIADCTGPNAG